jgi:N6-L-threonylcarbamoyladenine synthase
VLTDCIASQVDLHRIYGGVVPEIASRKHIEAIYGLADQALQQANLTRQDIDAVAVTYAPGLIGAVLVGVNFAKAAALAMDKPLIPVHHIRGHIAANYLAYPELEPPFLCLVVSGGHTMIIDVTDYTKMEILGTTLDDAAGECFDKVGRVLGMPYPGGAALDKAAQRGDEHKYGLPRSKPGANPYDMSFSGLKTATLNLIHHAEQVGEQLDADSLCASFCAAVSDTLVPRVVMALEQTGRKKIAVAGGVAANSRIRRDILEAAKQLGAEVYMPPLSLCGDNGAMIGAQAYYEYLAGNVADMRLNAYATKSILGETV